MKTPYHQDIGEIGDRFVNGRNGFLRVIALAEGYAMVKRSTENNMPYVIYEKDLLRMPYERILQT